MDLDQIWNSGDPRASEVAFRALLPAAEQLSGPERCYLVELHTRIARAEGAQGKVKEAHLSLDLAERLLLEQQTGYPVAAKIRLLLEKGRLHVFEKTPSQARLSFVEAWTLAINSGEDYLAVDVALMMAVTEPQKVQQEWIARALKLAETSPQENTKRWLGTLYMALGWKFYDMRQYETCLETFQKASSHLKIHGSVREVFVAKWSIGKLLRTMGRTEEALTIQNALLAELGIGGTRDGRLYEELAECLHTLRRSTEAQLYFELAYRELSTDTWMTDNQPVTLKRLKDLGKVK